MLAVFTNIGKGKGKSMNEILDFLQKEKQDIKEKIKEYLDKDYKTNKLNERLDYIEILINKANATTEIEAPTEF